MLKAVSLVVFCLCCLSAASVLYFSPMFVHTITLDSEGWGSKFFAFGAARKPSQDIDSLIRQVEALRQAQRDAAAKNHEPLKGLKRRRRQSRAFQNTILST